MNLTVITWVLTFVAGTLLTFKRPVYGVCLYLFTFFVNPPFWWWGDLIATVRWNLYAAIILGVALFLHRARGEESGPKPAPWPAKFALLMAANAIFVHYLLAPDRDVSWAMLELLLKFVTLYFLMVHAIRTRDDLRLAVWGIIICASYIGYEVTINERGSFSGGRLEGVGAAGVQNSNELASLLLAVVPFGGYLFLTGGWRDKTLAAVTTMFALNVLLLCNSRGAFLGLMAAGIIIIAIAPKGVRAKVGKGLALGSVALLLLLNDPKIVDRFMTTFVGAEERDSSATTRFVIWTAAWEQIKDHPLGAGGESFSKVLGRRYLPGVGYDSDGRAVHNGYVNEICNWGFQGFFLRLAFLIAAFRVVRRTGKACGLRGETDGALFAAVLMSAAAGTMITAFFGDYLDDEWLIWLAALMVVHGKVYAVEVAQPQAVDAPRIHPRPIAVPSN